ncbi:MAG: hypothetical protein UT10_C0029G0012 [Candidatus Woesebacteria bacterium GW2011_GWB1_38_8b]|uniref:Uncharacterized protein n=1 Tax=Candidatus Woesebacteria bacterium GW2011_GWB1_38_8b TaxID=1618571 RepID=A0A0G0L5M1_9BACT|nr:MAG: hypothetical protein UT10_C0029G0012 [Candidatus Woesebacteria bacterium GW2011_GWB1_38_8b]
MNKNNQKGVVHIILLIFVFVALIGVIAAFMVFKPSLNSIKEMTGVNTTNVSPTASASTTELEKEVNAQELTDPSTDFTQVDQDINSL